MGKRQRRFTVFTSCTTSTTVSPAATRVRKSDGQPVLLGSGATKRRIQPVPPPSTRLLTRHPAVAAAGSLQQRVRRARWRTSTAGLGLVETQGKAPS